MRLTGVDQSRCMASLQAACATHRRSSTPAFMQ